jgi:hypothetical protein
MWIAFTQSSQGLTDDAGNPLVDGFSDPLVTI